MNSEHWLLCVYWSLFSILHSGLATEQVKGFFRRCMHGAYKYYRLIYSFIASVTLLLVIVVQLSIVSFNLPMPSGLRYFLGIPIGITGILLMVCCIRKYFFKLSGVRVGDHEAVKLEVEGMHKYVRHPLYLGTLLFIWSLFLFFPLLSNLLASMAITGYTLIGIRAEEKKLIKTFGKEYNFYIIRTPVLIPNLPKLAVRIFTLFQANAGL